MRLATLRRPADGNGTRTVAVRIDERDGEEVAVPLAAPDLDALLDEPGWQRIAEEAAADALPFSSDDLAPVVSRPRRILCVGQNYLEHIAEMGRTPPEYPTLFTKFASTLVGPHDDIILPAASDEVDWEAELAVVIGRRVRAVDRAGAVAAIAGYTIVNDVTARDWQRRTPQWLQGKTWDRTTPCGPVLVTADELDVDGTGSIDLAIRCLVDDEIVQEARTSDMVFDPAAVVAYVSTFTTLEPGDLIATGTPSGVGAGRKPPRWLHAGQQLVTEIQGIGRCENPCRTGDAETSTTRRRT